MAGCMITVSASAVRIPFGIPPQLDWYPTDVRFVLVVLAVGAVVVTLAVLGFQRLATFATVCSALDIPDVRRRRPSGPARAVRLFGRARLLRDGPQVRLDRPDPRRQRADGLLEGRRFSRGFATSAMHGALSDMAMFRFARKKSYGLFSSFGMFLGHYLAWICAGVMGAGAAVLLGSPLVQLDAGEVGYQALGWAGALAVVIAGWTTSNPTLYRVGLALQAVTPNWSRAKITLVAGVVTTVVACFPFVFTGLLDYVAVLRPADFADRCDRGNRALDLPAHRAAALLVKPSRPRDQLGRAAGVGHLGGPRGRVGTQRNTAPVLPIPAGVCLRHGLPTGCWPRRWEREGATSQRAMRTSKSRRRRA